MNRYRLYLLGVMLLTALLGLLGHKLFGAEPVKGAVRQLELARASTELSAELEAIMPLEVPVDTNTYFYSFGPLMVIGPYPEGVTNYIIQHGTSPGVSNESFSIGAADNEFYLTGLEFDTAEYFICAFAQNAVGTSQPSLELHWPPPKTNYVEMTLQYSNALGWLDVASRIVTNPVGNKFWRWRGDETNKAWQETGDFRGADTVWADIPDTVSATSGPLLPAKLLIRQWSSWATNAIPYMIPE